MLSALKVLNNPVCMMTIAYIAPQSINHIISLCCALVAKLPGSQNLDCLSNRIIHFLQSYFHLTISLQHSTQLWNCMRFNKLNFTTWLKVADRITHFQSSATQKPFGMVTWLLLITLY